MKFDESKITMLPVAELHPHKDNPRKALGDLTELCESIKTNGVMQNLTVIPIEEAEPDKHDGYTVIIGHRRLEAAKMAGLNEVPCVITHMDRATQLSTMLLENIQRNDLTATEQAQGFQLMIDMGSTAKEISKLSGFSEKTVRHRLEIAKLDKNKLNEINEVRQLSFGELAELEKIDDIGKRNELLDDLGTPNFKWRLSAAVNLQNIKKLETLAQPKLLQFAEKKQLHECWRFDMFKTLKSESDVHDLEVPAKEKNVKYFYTVENIKITVYVKRPAPQKSEAEKNEQEKKRRKKECVNKLDELAEKCFEARKAFILDFDSLSVTATSVFDFVTMIIVAPDFGRTNKAILKEFVGIKDSPYVSFVDGERERILNSANSRKRAIVAAYAASGDSETMKMHDYTGHHGRNSSAKELSRIYDALRILGYEKSDEESEYLAGIHPAYRIKE